MYLYIYWYKYGLSIKLSHQNCLIHPDLETATGMKREVKLRNLGEFCTIWQKGERPQAGSKLPEFINLFKVPKDIHTVTMEKKLQVSMRIYSHVSYSCISVYDSVRNYIFYSYRYSMGKMFFPLKNTNTSALLDKFCEVLQRFGSGTFLFESKAR
jgi:hypothetical protein